MFQISAPVARAFAPPLSRMWSSEPESPEKLYDEVGTPKALAAST